MSAPIFYVIGEADYESHTTLRLSVERQGRTDSQLIRGDFPPEPISAKRHLGSKAVDYTDMGIRIVSSAFRDSVTRHGLSGAAFAPLTVDGHLSRWYLMGVTGSCGPFDYSASERFERVIHHPGGGEWRGASLRGFAIDPARWSGHDFFLPPRVNSVVVTQDAVVALGDARLSNVQFTPTSGYEIPESYVLKSSRSDSDS